MPFNTPPKVVTIPIKRPRSSTDATNIRPTSHVMIPTYILRQDIALYLRRWELNKLPKMKTFHTILLLIRK